MRFSLSETDLADKPAIIAWWNGITWIPLTTLTDGPNAIKAEVHHFSLFAVIPCVPVEPGQEGCREPVPDYCPSCQGLWVNGWSYQQCTGGGPAWFIDQDYDGMDDTCESDLIQAFRPLMHFMMDCNWDHGNGRMGGEYYWAAQPVSDRIRLVYLPAYYHDCGGAGSSGHSGDSEFVAFDVIFDDVANHWVLTRGFYSAHCGTDWPFSTNCRWYNDPLDFEWLTGHWGGPVSVYVSHGKHANYPNQARCYNAISQDNCAPAYSDRYPMVLIWDGLQTVFANIGSRSHPFVNVTAAASGSSMTHPLVVERLWGTRPQGTGYADCIILGHPFEVCTFNGWQLNWYGSRPPPYGSLLSKYLGI
jgi:hypothetical protein